MPRRKQGGRRQGTAGKNYPNRSDLQGSRVMEFTGQQYGARARQVAGQQAVPASFSPASQAMAAAGPPPAREGGLLMDDAAVDATGVRTIPSAAHIPGQIVDLLGPTARPDEPLTAGAPFGAGPGPEVLPREDPDAAVIDRLRMLARASGSPAMLRLLEGWEDSDV
jgi:hypothetical protein